MAIEVVCFTIGIFSIFFSSVLSTSGIKAQIGKSGQFREIKSGSAWETQIYNLISIDSVKNRYRRYLIVLQGKRVSTFHGRQAPGERPYLKTAKAPEIFESEDLAELFVNRLIHTKTTRKKDPYRLDSKEGGL